MIVITLDSDWVPEKVLEESIALLKENNVKATLFLTGGYECAYNCDDEGLEVGLHPNIIDITEAGQKINRLKQLYPRAVGVRNHTLVHSSRFFAVYRKLNILYSSNFFLPGQIDLSPVTFRDGLVEFPIFFMDDYYLHQKLIRFTLDDLTLGKRGLKVLAFHPIHIFLNTQSIGEYEAIKANQDDYDYLVRFRKEGKGIGSLFYSLLNYIKKNRIRTYTFRELLENSR